MHLHQLTCQKGFSWLPVSFFFLGQTAQVWIGTMPEDRAYTPSLPIDPTPTPISTATVQFTWGQPPFLSLTGGLAGQKEGRNCLLLGGKAALKRGKKSMQIYSEINLTQATATFCHCTFCRQPGQSAVAPSPRTPGKTGVLQRAAGEDASMSQDPCRINPKVQPPTRPLQIHLGNHRATQARYPTLSWFLLPNS